MGLRRRLLRELLNSLKYIKNLTEKQIRASLWRGETTLYDIELDPQQLQQLFHDSFPCGLEILRATVKEVCVRIPWSQVMTQSIVVVAHNVEVEAEVHCEDEPHWKEHVSKIHRKFLGSQLKRIEGAPVSFSSSASGAFDQLRARMMDGMQIHISSATLSLMSTHPRHFPGHGPSDGKRRELEEVLRVTGEDISMGPSNINHIPCDKLKHMATYLASERALQLTKFLKCQSFRVIPGRSKNGCPYAATEYMEPAVLTCNMTTRYPSDGSRICPFVISSDLLYDIPNALKVAGCECQLRAFTAIVGDVSMLEGWRMSADILKLSEKVTSSNAVPMESDETLLQDTSSIARTFARGEDWKRQTSATGVEIDSSAEQKSPHVAPVNPIHEPPVVDIPRLSSSSAVSNVCSAASPASAVPESCSAGAVGSPERRRSSSFDSDRLGILTSNLNTPPAPSSPAISCADAPEEGNPSTPLENPTSPSKGGSGNAGNNSIEGTPVLMDTSSMARDLAQGQSRRSGTSSSSKPWNKLLRQAHKASSTLSSHLSIGGSIKMITVGASAANEGTHAVSEHAGAANVITLREPIVNSPSAAPDGTGDEDCDQFVEPHSPISSNADGEDARGDGETKLSEHGQGDEKEFSLDRSESFKDLADESLLDAEATECTKPVVEPCSDDSQSDDANDGKCDRHESEDEYDEEDDVDDLCDAEDYFSVVSGDSCGDAHSVRSLDHETLSPEQQSTWLKPVLKWLGGKAPTQISHEDWPEMKNVSKRMSFAISHLEARLTVVDNDDASWSSGAPSSKDCEAEVDVATTSGNIEFRVDALTWRSDTTYSLPAAQLDCVSRLTRGLGAASDERNTQHSLNHAPQASRSTSSSPASRVNSRCLPALLDGAQRMDWPRAALLVQLAGPSEEQVLVMEKRDDEPQVLDAPMISIGWKPRDCPPSLVEQYSVEATGGLVQYLRSWPMHVSLRHARLFMDSVRWTFARRCQERCKPYLLSKLPSPSLLPLVPCGEDVAEQLFPVEAFNMSFDDCDFVEPYSERTLLQERRWPLRVSVPNMSMRSNSHRWAFDQILSDSVDTGVMPQRSSSRAEGGSSNADDVTIPKEMFDHLVRRAAEATLKDSQVVAAREELQKAYIALASMRASSGQTSSSLSSILGSVGDLQDHSVAGLSSSIGVSGGAKSSRSSWGGALWEKGFAGLLPAGLLESGGTVSGVNSSETSPSKAVEIESGGGVVAPSSAVEDDLDRLRRRCAQLESSLASQGLAHRRLETELAHYQALARNELRQALYTKAHVPCDAERAQPLSREMYTQAFANHAQL